MNILVACEESANELEAEIINKKEDKENDDSQESLE